jgi:hypothetical protein
MWPEPSLGEFPWVFVVAFVRCPGLLVHLRESLHGRLRFLDVVLFLPHPQNQNKAKRPA